MHRGKGGAADPDVMDVKRLSKAIAYVLRHSPLAANDSSGWVSVPDLQANLRLKASLEDIKYVVENNDKVGLLAMDFTMACRMVLL